MELVHVNTQIIVKKYLRGMKTDSAMHLEDVTTQGANSIDY